MWGFLVPKVDLKVHEHKTEGWQAWAFKTSSGFDTAEKELGSRLFSVDVDRHMFEYVVVMMTMSLNNIFADVSTSQCHHQCFKQN